MAKTKPQTANKPKPAPPADPLGGTPPAPAASAPQAAANAKPADGDTTTAEKPADATAAASGDQPKRPEAPELPKAPKAAASGEGSGADAAQAIDSHPEGVSPGTEPPSPTPGREVASTVIDGAQTQFQAADAITDHEGNPPGTVLGTRRETRDGEEVTTELYVTDKGHRERRVVG